MACLDYLLRVPDLTLVHRGARLQGFKIQGGGMVATAMVAVARLGGQAEFWSVIGEDDHGQIIAEELAREGVDLSQTLRTPEQASPFNFVLVDGQTGERAFLWPGVEWQCERLPVQVDWSRLDGAGALLVDGFWGARALEGLRRARARGLPTCGDISHIRGNERLLEQIDYLVVPRFAAEEITGEAGETALRALAGFGGRLVAITLGAEGVIYLADGVVEHLPAFAVDVVDTTGAGDVFHGALAYGVARGWSPRRLLLFASAVAALKCRCLGGRTGIPSLEEVRAFLEERMAGEVFWDFIP